MKTEFVKTSHPRAQHQRLAVYNHKQVEPMIDTQLMARIKQAWEETKSPLGYTSFTAIHNVTNIPYLVIFELIKGFHTINPYSVRFNINRTGKVVYFKLIPKELGHPAQWQIADCVV